MISEALADSLRYNSFNPRHHKKWAYREGRTLSRNNVYEKAIIVNIVAKGVSFIPTTMFLKIFNNSHRLFDNKDVSVICPLTIYSREEKKAPDTIIRRMFSIDDTEGLIKVTTGKGLDYIGGTGIIFDQHWNPLMMTGIEISETQSEVDRSWVCPILYVSPDVFEREDCVSRAIVRKLIPWYAKNFVYSSLWGATTSSLRETVRIKVEDFSHMFISPIAPRGNFNKEIHELCHESLKRAVLANEDNMML